MAKKIEYLFLMVTTLCFVHLSAGCDENNITNCVTDNGLEFYGFPTLLEVPDVELFCTNLADVISCFDGFQDCGFVVDQNTYGYENMGEFICSNTESYDEYYNVISNVTYRANWEACFETFLLDGTESQEEGCGEVATLLQCHLDEVANEPEDARNFVEEFGEAGLAFYYTYYGCTSGSLTIQTTPGLLTIGLLLLLSWYLN